MSQKNKAKPSSVKLALIFGALAVLFFASTFFMMARSA